MQNESNGHLSEVDHLNSVLDQLRQRKHETEQRISVAEQLLALYSSNGAGDEETAQELHSFTAASPKAPRPVNLRGLNVKNAVIAYAQSLPDGLFRIVDASAAFVRDGLYATRESAAASMYWHLKKDPRFTKVGAGVFRFQESLTGPGLPARLAAAKASITKPDGYEVGIPYMGRPAPPAVGRDHSLIALPERLRGFKFDTIRGEHYLTAAIKVARYLGGSMTGQELAAAFWHGDLVPRVPTPRKMYSSVWSSLNTDKAGRYIRRTNTGYELVA